MEIPPFLIPQSAPQVIQQNPQVNIQQSIQPKVRQFNVPRTTVQLVQAPIQTVQTPIQPITKQKTVVLPSLNSIKLSPVVTPTVGVIGRAHV